MDGDELQRRFPGYRLPREIRCLYQPDGGFLLPERCNVAHAALALARGAEVHCREPVLEWGAGGGRAWVRTTRGRYEAGRLVICAGSWASKLVSELGGLAVPERQVLAWLQPSRPEYFEPGAPSRSSIWKSRRAATTGSPASSSPASSSGSTITWVSRSIRTRWIASPIRGTRSCYAPLPSATSPMERDRP